MIEMTEEWVSLWYRCLTWNIDYGNYCRAKAADDEKACQELEAKFPSIAGIYADFDELDIWPDDGIQSEQWKHWFEPRRALFMPEIGAVASATTHIVKQGHILLDVPLMAVQADTEKLIHQYLLSHYATPGFAPAATPKYNLYAANGKLALNLKEVRQACVSAGRSYAYDDEGGDVRFIDAVTEFVRQHIDDMEWGLDEKARKLLVEKHQLTEENHRSFTARLTRCRRHFVALCRNTIRGRFPDVSEFDSLVLNKF